MDDVKLLENAVAVNSVESNVIFLVVEEGFGGGFYVRLTSFRHLWMQ